MLPDEPARPAGVLVAYEHRMLALITHEPSGQPVCVLPDRSRNAGAERVCEQIAASDVVGFDETGFRVQGKLHWVHFVRTGKYTLLMVRPAWVEAMEAMGILPSLGSREGFEAGFHCFDRTRINSALERLYGRRSDDIEAAAIAGTPAGCVRELHKVAAAGGIDPCSRRCPAKPSTPSAWPRRSSPSSGSRSPPISAAL